MRPFLLLDNPPEKVCEKLDNLFLGCYNPIEMTAERDLLIRYRRATQSGHRDGARLILAWTRDIIPRSAHGGP